MELKCPVRPAHFMVEIAEGLFQCPFCGYGPSQQGDHAFWAVSCIDVIDGVVEGICITWEEPFYTVSEIRWELDADGDRVPGSLREELGSYEDQPDTLAELALPVIIRDVKKWDLPPGKPTLHPLTYPSPLGVKEIGLDPSGGRARRSPKAPTRRG